MEVVLQCDNVQSHAVSWKPYGQLWQWWSGGILRGGHLQSQGFGVWYAVLCKFFLTAAGGKPQRFHPKLEALQLVLVAGLFCWHFGWWVETSPCRAFQNPSAEGQGSWLYETSEGFSMLRRVRCVAGNPTHAEWTTSASNILICHIKMWGLWFRQSFGALLIILELRVWIKLGQSPNAHVCTPQVWVSRRQVQGTGPCRSVDGMRKYLLGQIKVVN